MARAALAVLLGSALLVGTLASSSEFTSPHVAHLTSKDYEEKTSDGKVYFIKYYAPWCGHCKRLANTWKELGEELKDNPSIVIAHVDCTTDRDVCQTAQVKGYPTLKVIHKGEELKAYRGPREKDALKTFVVEAAKEVTTEA
ncbi:hypothetical protein GPECTOR_16g539 [Gonium pectorale]|uniref:Thioredoxin domain-containing protein n=1 Tax=Gonium pectorale TaxID=33097 RepID=A0A150GKI6_GONPE|nr:hypothetical protein GPECTOR_16g539 [Gonium pectorale]|eukprot:KXZ50366.1 hypothetical protein GPECTOR_16g539 [Gonium pectorale]